MSYAIHPTPDRRTPSPGSLCGTNRPGRNTVCAHRTSTATAAIALASGFRLLRVGMTSLLLTAAAGAGMAGDAVSTINDTGQRLFYTADAVAPGGEPAHIPGQDAGFGRDAAAADGALVKTGGGAAGFDFTKLGADGQPLAIQDQPWVRDGNGFDAGSEAAGTRWSCVRDNTTGLIWESKTFLPVPDLHDREWTYSWYSSAARPDGTANGHNGLNPGSENLGHCFDKYHPANNPDGNRCDTAGLVAAVNAAGLCGGNDWRMPTLHELYGLIHFGTHWPAIDTAYFPNTPGEFGNPNNPTPNTTWTGSPHAFSSGWAHAVYLEFGQVTHGVEKAFATATRLVRTAP